MTPPPASTRHRVGDLEFRVVSSYLTRASNGCRAAPVVLVHGIGMSHRYLARLHSVLAPAGTVLSVDLPGFGGLRKPRHDLDVGQMAEALGALLDELGGGPFVLVGHSMGTQWTTELAVRRPDLARAVVLIGPVADKRHRTVIGQAARLTADTLGEPPGANALVLGDYLRCGPRWYLNQLRHMLEYPIEDRVERLEVPMLIIRGDRDPIAPRPWCRRLRDRGPKGSMLVEIPGRMHNAQHSAPRAVASAIRHHLRLPARDDAAGAPIHA